MEAKINALLHQIRTGNIRCLQAKLLGYIAEKPCSLQELRNATTIVHQTITARLSELEDMGLIKKGSRIKGQPFSIFHYVKDPAERIRLQRKKAAERRQKWVDLGKKNGWVKQLQHTMEFKL